MKKWQKILELISKTGDRFIFEDEKGNFFVISSLAEYEKKALTGFQNDQVKSLSEEELLDKINQDIAVWKAGQQDERLADNVLNFDDESDEDDTEDQYYFEPVEDEE